MFAWRKPLKAQWTTEMEVIKSKKEILNFLLTWSSCKSGYNHPCPPSRLCIIFSFHILDTLWLIFSGDNKFDVFFLSDFPLHSSFPIHHKATIMLFEVPVSFLFFIYPLLYISFPTLCPQKFWHFLFPRGSLGLSVFLWRRVIHHVLPHIGC